MANIEIRVSGQPVEVVELVETTKANYEILQDEPDMEEYLFATIFGDEFSEATDGCYPVEPDGHCEHGAPSWELHWGVI